MDKIFFLELMNTQNAHWDTFRKEFDRLGVSEGMPRILYILLDKEGCVQKELAGYCKVRESTLTVMLKRLEGLGWIRKEKVNRSGGKRAFGIYLTENGRKKAEEICVAVEEIDRRSLAGFSEKEKEQFYSFMGRVRDNLKE